MSSFEVNVLIYFDRFFVCILLFFLRNHLLNTHAFTWSRLVLRDMVYAYLVEMSKTKKILNENCKQNCNTDKYINNFSGLSTDCIKNQIEPNEFEREREKERERQTFWNKSIMFSSFEVNWNIVEYKRLLWVSSLRFLFMQLFIILLLFRIVELSHWLFFFSFLFFSIFIMVFDLSVNYTLWIYGFYQENF